MFTEQDDTITLTLSRDDFDLLLLALGAVTGLAFKGEGPLSPSGAVGLINRINVGNPNFIPYEQP